MISKKFMDCWGCGIAIEEDGLIVISGKRLGTAHYCRFCYQQDPPHPDEVIRGRAFEFVGPKPPGPKAQNQIYITDTHDDRITKLETNVANHEQKIGKLEEDMKRESSPDSNILYNANAKRIRKLEIALKQSILAIENEL